MPGGRFCALHGVTLIVAKAKITTATREDRRVPVVATGVAGISQNQVRRVLRIIAIPPGHSFMPDRRLPEAKFAATLHPELDVDQSVACAAIATRERCDAAPQRLSTLEIEIHLPFISPS